jgi:hypothetical protein
MKKQLFTASILAFGMGLAQAQTPAPMQGTSQDPSSRGATTQTSPAGPGSSGAAATSATGAGTSDNAMAPQTFKGCLTGSSGNWTLAADNGQTLKVSGGDNQLSTFNNQQVNINGTQATDGTVKVVSIDKISDSCSNTGQAATSSSMSSQPSSSSSSTNMTGSSTSSAASQPPASSTENSSTSNTQSTSETATTSSTGQSATTPSSTTPPPSSTDQNAASSTTTSSQGNAAASTSPTAPNNDQNAGVGASGAASNQNAGQSASTTTGQTSDQSVRHVSDMDQNEKAAGGQRLPQTASPLPLLGLMGLGSLVTGLVACRKK